MTPLAGGYPNDIGHPAFPQDFLDFIRELNGHRVDYLLVGGYAVGMYGHVRATSDIDFLYRRTVDNVERLMKALQSFGAPSQIIDPVHLLQPNGVSAFGEPPNRIDLFASISGVTYDEAQADAIVLNLNGDALQVIGLHALRANKQATGRKKDRDDLRRLPKAEAP